MSTRSVNGTDYIIVGSGIAAVALAEKILAKDSSATILMLEAGGQMPIADYRKWLDFVMAGKNPTVAYTDAMKDADINQDGGFGLVGGRLLMRGGSTNHWGGWTPRLKPEDFQLGDVRPASINWPITYRDLASYYTKAEFFLDVSGDSNAEAAPRYGDTFPHPPLDYSAIDQVLIPTLKRHRYQYQSMPISRNPLKCRTTGTCDYCPFDALYTADTGVANLLRQYPNRLQLKIHSPVQTIVMSNKKTAVGVYYFDAELKENRLAEANKIIIAAGTVESTKLLLASSSASWSAGIANDSDHVGRHLVTHPMVRTVATMKKNPTHIEQELAFPTLASRHFDTPKYQAEGKMFFVRYGSFVMAPFANQLARGMSPAAVKASMETNTKIELRGFIEAFDHEENRVTLAPGSTNLGLPRTAIQFKETEEALQARKVHAERLQKILKLADLKDVQDRSYWGTRADHATGTCRMSATASEGVVDKNLKVHDTDNLYLCSNAVFPNGGAVNPTLTLVALALRLGEFI